MRQANTFTAAPEFPALSTAKFRYGKRRITTTAYLQLNGEWLSWRACTCSFGAGDPMQCALDYHRFKATQRQVAAETEAA